ncbi:adenylate kinase [Malaciobacter canalis]|uniref:Adenylate kinase n=1 Tax=Malaciobacter canalis TaxID=1912871 RepID=A0ABX4LR00_9BACT|nr:adenylate kinase [Malaciobacter canalis]PHO10395.1 adenylate kinase [Malaciobacter canalis]QEE32499.1 adenylate kinase [Malaciobacter canalis]
MKKLFLIIGAPGSGKTTDAELIASKHENITHYSTGDMLRAEIASGSSRGEEIDSFVSKGLIVPIDIVIETIVTAIKNTSTNIVVIDGYPRSIEQMKELDKYLKNEKEVELVNVIEVEVSQDTAFKRVLGRAADAVVVRDDDNEEVFLNRMKLYTEPLEEIKSFYTQKDILKVISGEGTIDQIVNEMDNFIQSRV